MGAGNVHKDTAYQRQVKHAKMRFKRCHGKSLTKNFRRTLKQIIQEGDATLVQTQGKRQIYDVLVKGDTYRLVYDHSNKNIVTFLPI
tara:strand:+ start:2371 stop:2631 length:261 start_codon:yes stop_codon:yes gene_type:complete